MNFSCIIKGFYKCVPSYSKIIETYQYRKIIYNSLKSISVKEKAWMHYAGSTQAS